MRIKFVTKTGNYLLVCIIYLIPYKINIIDIIYSIYVRITTTLQMEVRWDRFTINRSEDSKIELA